MKIRINLIIVLSISFACECYGQFEDYSSIWQIPSMSYDAFYGNGISVFDYDNDNLDNITVAYPYIGISGFRVSQGELLSDFFVPLPLNIKQLIWADFNNDGDKELFVTTYGAGLFLYDYSSEGLTLIEGSFSSIISGFHYGASAADYDNDGDLDLFVTQYSNYNFGAPLPNLLFRNEGNFEFTEVGASLGVNAATNNSFQSVWVDFNRDGWQDVYVVNDKNIPNLFYQNNSGISFTEISTVNNTNIAMSCMSNSISDFNRDGFFDIFISDVHPVLLEGDSSGVYIQVAYDAGISTLQTAWGSLWIDSDLDGWDDIYICQGGTVLESMPNQYFKNNQGIFSLNNSFDSYLKASFVNAKGDFDGDCSPDFVVMNAAPNSYDVWKGKPAENNYIKLDLEGTISNKDAAGTIVEVYTDSSLSMKVVLYGDNYISQSSNLLLFGLGNAETIDSIAIFWPLGLIERYYNVEPNHFYHAIEGANELVDLNSISYNINLCPSNQQYVVTPDSSWTQWQWSNGEFNNSQVVNSDTLILAQAWNNQGQVFTLKFNVNFSPNFPIVAIENYPCLNQQSILIIENNYSWDVILNETYLTNDSLSLGSGSYSLSFTNSQGCSHDTIFEVEIYDSLNVVVNTNAPCPDSLTYYSIDIQNEQFNNCTLEGLEYFSGQILPGVYPFTITSNVGCQYADTLRIIERVIPHFSLLSDTICSPVFTSSDIQIIDLDGYEWTFDNYVAASQPDLFTFEFSDSLGCPVSFTEYVFVVDELNANITEAIYDNYSILTVNPSEGIPPYSIIWENVIENNSFETSSNTTVSYYIEDSIGCFIQGEYTSSSTNLEDFNFLEQSIFFDGEYCHCLKCDNTNFEVYSSTGVLVDYGRFVSPYKLKQGLPIGVYLIRIDNFVVKAIVQQ